MATTTAALDPQLVMAARRGDINKLKDLLLLKDDEEQHQQQVVVEVDRRPAAAPPSRLLDGLTIEGQDSLLHVVAACGDGEEFRDCAKMICGKKKGALVARNHKGDTPLHCAAGAGNAEMVSCLVALAGDETLTAVNKEEFLRMRNKRGETALHQAVRAASKASMDQMMSLDSELACIPGEGEEGASPLYLAISLGQMAIARHLFDISKGKLSYSGPDGRNVLHEAVSRAKALPTLLEWFKDGQQAGDQMVLSQLTIQRDQQQDGSTPLHLAASLEGWPAAGHLSRWFPHVGPQPESATTLLLDANTCAAYQPDNQGLYPIHVAAMAGSLKVVKALLQRCPDCATLRDGKQGTTFLHVAVNEKRHSVVEYACRVPEFSSILNVQDNAGDTALHRAVRVGDVAVFNCLVRNRRVRLDASNNKGLTPLDLSWRKVPPMLYFTSNPRSIILVSLLSVGAPYGGGRPDLFVQKHITKRDDAKEAENLTNSTQVMGIVSVLVATVTFASAFTLPGGYRSADDAAAANHGLAGTPVLAAGSNYAFDAFILSDTLAFICSCLATFSLVYAGLPAIDLSMRYKYFNISAILLSGSARSLVSAFALGLYVVLAPVSHMLATAVCVISFAALLYGNLSLRPVICIANTARARFGILRIPAAWRHLVNLFIALWPFWSFVIIFGLPAILRKVHV